MEAAMIPCAQTLPSSPFQTNGFWGNASRCTTDDVPWIWDGYLGPGRVSLLTSMWKSGKTTLLSVLLQRMGTGGTLAGLAVAPGKALVISEEPEGIWQPRLKQFQLGHVYIECQPFLGKPTPEQWHGLIAFVAEMHRQHGLGLLVIDTLTTFLPGGNEATAGAVMNALLPLVQLTRPEFASCSCTIRARRRARPATRRAARAPWGALPTS